MTITTWQEARDASGIGNWKAFARHVHMNPDTVRKHRKESDIIPDKCMPKVLEALNGHASAASEPAGEQITVDPTPGADEEGTVDPLVALEIAAASEELPPDPDTEVSQSAILARAKEFLDSLDAAPSVDEIENLFNGVINDGALDIVRDDILADIKERWPGVYKVETLKSTWTQLKRQLRQQVQREQGGEVVDHPDPNAEPDPEERAAERERLWPIVRELAESPNLLRQAINAVHSLGVAGEENAIALVQLSAVSAVMLNPVSPFIHGESASGKSFSVGNTLKLHPPENVIHLSAASARSLVYGQESLKYRIMYVFEATALQQAENSMYSMLLRTLMSEGRIVYETTVEDSSSPSGFRTERIEREGPIAVIVTSTGEIHAENATRMFRLTTNATAEQTKEVMRMRTRIAAGKGHESDVDLELWRDFHRWIANGPRDVVIPFAEQLGEFIPPVSVRLRRDINALMGMIKSHALLCQAQRETDDKGAVIATLDDYGAVRDIVAPVIAESTGRKLSEIEVKLVEYIRGRLRAAAAAAPKPGRGTRPDPDEVVQVGDLYTVRTSVRALATELGSSSSTMGRVVKKAIADDLLVNDQEVRGQPMLLKLGALDVNRDESETLLPTVEQLQGLVSQ